MGRGNKRKPYTPFGKHLRFLMWQRDIRSWTELERVIERNTGSFHSHQSMSKYAVGKVAIPVEFVQDFAEALGLNAKERTDIAELLTYHSRPPQDHSNSA